MGREQPKLFLEPLPVCRDGLAMPGDSLMHRLEQELNCALHARDYAPLRVEGLGFVHDSYVDYGGRPSVPASRIRMGADARELLASLAEQKPASIRANFIMTHAGHGIVSLLAGAGKGMASTAIEVELVERRFDLIDDEDNTIAFTGEDEPAAAPVLGKAEMLDVGERVVELGGLCGSAATFGGALSGAIGVASIVDGWLLVAAGALAGALLGALTGQLAARALYRTGGGYASVLRPGRAALAPALRAACAGAVPAGIAVVAIAALAFGATAQLLPLLGLALGIGIGLAAILGCLGALL